MFVRVWEYDVAAAQVDDFVTAYAADGDWARLFRRAAGYLGTELYRDTDRSGRFLTVDRWTDEGSWRAFLGAWDQEYARLGERLAGLTVDQRALLEGAS